MAAATPSMVRAIGRRTTEPMPSAIPPSQAPLVLRQDDLVPRLLQPVRDRSERPQDAADEADERDGRPCRETPKRGDGHDRGEQEAAWLADRGEQERDRDRRAGQRADEALGDGEKPERPIRTRGERAPVGDGGMQTRRGWEARRVHGW
jgi:hypothetical protein